MIGLTTAVLFVECGGCLAFGVALTIPGVGFRLALPNRLIGNPNGVGHPGQEHDLRF
jgi:hypothetical protein